MLLNTEELTAPGSLVQPICGGEDLSRKRQSLQSVLDECLRNSPYRNWLKNVRVQVTDGDEVLLLGTVSLFYYKAQATESIKRAASQMRVNNRLLEVA
jgi:hypothetical protein